MIIHRVRSEHVLKYATLDLQDIPAQGLIGISGHNEAGKSSIGEIICFALFGRTFSYQEKEIAHVIRWGEPRCTVSLEFSLAEQHYTVSRFLDEQGNHSVHLSEHPGKSLARGVEAVKETLETLLGFGFEEFIESFYLAQREITTPHPHSTAVKKIAGIAALEQVSTRARAESHEEQRTMQEVQSAMVEVEQHLEALHFDPALLPALEQQHNTLHQQQEHDAQQIASWQAAIERHQDMAAKLHATVDMLGRIGVATTYHGWRAHVAHGATDLAALVLQAPSDPTLTDMLGALQAVIDEAQQRVAEVNGLRHHANLYRQHLSGLLDPMPAAPEPQGAEPFATTQARLQTELHAARRSRSRIHIGLALVLFLAAGVWALWGLLMLAPQSRLAQSLLTGLTTTSGWLLPIAVCSSVLAGLAGWRGRQLGATMAQRQQSLDDVHKRMLTARQHLATLEALDTLPLPQMIKALAALPDPEVAAGAHRFRHSAAAAWLDAARLAAYQAEIGSTKDRLLAYLLEQCQTCTTRQKNLQEAMTTRQEHLQRLQEDITREQARHRQYREIQAAIAQHQEHMAECQRHIQIRELACDLLQGSAQHIAKTFNRDIRALVSRTLPLLTQDRYAQLKIDENLDVQVFSNDKRDFMQLEEISSGTQRQIMLAVRLALSQQFINTTLGCRQFIFLDEPFAFFDEARTRSALQALPQLSPELSQIWVVAQSFPSAFAFDLHIPCRQGQDVLMLSGG
jgi:DNA repair exonuclease SbcCD ATPase subunit